MKRLFYILPLLLVSQCWGTITLVQKSSNGASSGSPFTTTLSNTAAGNAIVVIVNSHSATGTAVSDGVNTYSSTSQCANGSDQVQFFYVLSGAGNSGTLTITVSFSTGNNIYANAREYHTTSGTFSLDASACTTSPSSTSTPSSDSITTTGTLDVLAGAMTDFNATSGGCGTGWTTNCTGNTNQSSIVDEQGDDIGVSAGTYSAKFTLGSAQSDWMVGILALKTSSGGPTCGQSIAMMGVGCR